jgi:predicted nucleic acid-binding protein
MNTLAIDASIAVKWVVEEEGTEEALILRRRGWTRSQKASAAVRRET